MSEDKREDDDDMAMGGAAGSPMVGGGAAASAEPSVRRSMKSTHHPLTVLRCKVAIVGDSKVGKTTLKEMFISGGRNYLNEYNMTVGVDFKVKSVPIPDSNFEVELYMFDCGGEKIFQQREG
jgi:GTPase SAR1 family protein